MTDQRTNHLRKRKLKSMDLNERFGNHLPSIENNWS